MMRSLCLWNFMDFAHSQIYSPGSPDMEWPQGFHHCPTRDPLHNCKQLSDS